MHRAFCCAICLVALQSIASAEPATRPVALTIVLEFQGPRSQYAVDAMQREVEDIFQNSRLNIAWRAREEFANSSVDNLVLFRFKGKCVLEPVGYLFDERGPLAFTYSTDGYVFPFSEVACDRVTAAVRSAMAGGDFAKADLLLGRALGRVMAHELIHMLSRSHEHGHEGIAKPALSGKQLIAPILHLAPSDVERIYTQP